MIYDDICMYIFRRHWVSVNSQKRHSFLRSFRQEISRLSATSRNEVMETVSLEKTIIKQLGESEDIHGSQILFGPPQNSHHFFICEIDGRDVEIGEAPKMCVALAESYMSIVYCICQ